MNILAFSWRDFKKQKIKSIFGIIGILVSIFLLSAVGILIDSLSYSYLDVATSQAGSADIDITTNISPNLNFNLFMDEKTIENTLHVSEIDYYFPRILMLVDAEPFGNTEMKTRIMFYGINTTLEQNSGTLGNLYLCDNYTLVETNQIFKGPIPNGHCIILQGTAKVLNVTAGDWLLLSYAGNTENFTIDAVCVQNERFSAVETNLIITELPQAQKFLNEPGKVNYLLATIKDREKVYDTRDIPATTKRLMNIGSEIQEQLGFGYSITLPKLEQLQSSSMVTMMMTVMMVFVSILSMLITGILINSILTTSVEEKIREFGIIRVVGGKKRNNILVVLSQGLFMGIIGTIGGILLAVFIIPWILTLLFNSLNLWSQPIPFIVLPKTIILDILIGIAVSLVISLFPALKSGNINITTAIDPYRHDDEGYKLQKEGSANIKIILMGIAISIAGLIIFILFPRIMLTQDLALISSLFIALLLAVLIGMVFAFVGLVPAVEWLFLQIFKPFIRKYHPIVRLSLRRNRRRNMGNILMFSLTFSFIFFMSSFLTIRSTMTTKNLQFQYGSDLVLINQGATSQKQGVDIDLFNKILKTTGVKDASPVLYNSFDATELLALLGSATQEGIDLNSLNSIFSNAFNTGNKYKTFIGSITGFSQIDCGLVGINQSYVNMSDQNNFMWDKNSGTTQQSAFSAIFNQTNNNSIIISKNIADYIGVTHVGQKVRMVFANTNQNKDNGNATTMIVAGISSGMPGFFNFQSSQLSVYGGGVMMSLDNYLSWMNQGNLNNKNTTIDKIMINLRDNSEKSVDDFKTLINDLYGQQYNFLIDDNISMINLMTSGDNTIDLVMQIILTITILISLFGLISTMYSTLMERLYEIGLLRAMGLRADNVRGMFVSESLIMMLAAGTIGMFIGSFIAYIMVSNVAILSQMPTPYVLDIGTLLRTYAIAISACVGGIIIMTRKIYKWSVIEIFRSSF